MDSWDMIADRRHQLVAILQNLNEGQWHTPSLCRGWTVRDVVGHLVTPFALGMGKMFLRLIGNGFNVDKTLMQAAQQLAQRPTPELVRVLRANAQTRWTPPDIGPEAPLTDILMHTLDICHPLHIPHTIEPARLRRALNFLVSRKSRAFTKSDWRAGLRLAPDDLEWSWGDGLEVRGKAQNVVMVLGGRTAMLDDLTGPGVPPLQARLLSPKSS
jgi:uncharacterized protein (TIGR03083 family)